MTIIRLFREGGAGGDGGGLSLQDVLDPEKKGAGGELTDLEKQQQLDQQEAQAQEALVKEATNTDGTLKEGYIKDATTGKVSKDPNFTPPQPEGLNADGTLKEGYIKDKDGNVIKDPAAKPAEDDEPLTPEQEAEVFFETLEKITGNKLEIKYPEGVDPLSAKGLAMREVAVMEHAQVEFERYIEKTFPRSYALMLHTKNGGTEEEFFTNTSAGFTLPDKAVFDASADLQTAVYRHDLKVKGLDTEAIDALVEKAIKDNKLKEKADTAYTTIDTYQKKQVEDAAKINEQQEATQAAAIKTMLAKVDESITNNSRFVIPDTDKPAFKQFVIDNLRYDKSTGKFSLVQAIEPESITQMVEALFFQHKKGDLKSLIIKQAKTQAAQNIRARVNSKGITPGGGAGPEKTDTNFLPLSDVVKQ